MIRLILTTAAVMAVLAGPASAATHEEMFSNSQQPAPAEAAGGQDLRSPDAVDAAAHRGIYATSETQRGPYALNRDYGSPDAADAARDLPPVQVPVVAASNPSGGFDWGDAGIGAAGMVGLFSIAGACALMLSGRRRRHGLA